MARSGNVGIIWSVPPSALAANVERYGEIVREGVKHEAERIADELEAEAKADAPWTDRTGDARAGLTGDVVEVGDRIGIVLYHTVPYGIFLELANAGNYAIVGPVLERNYGRTMAHFQRLLD